MTAPGAIYHLALREIHAAAGARFDVRSGWSLPVDYGDVEAEYRAIREGAAIIDRSHRSRFVVTGTDAADVLAGAFAGHPTEIEEGRAARLAALREGSIDDLALVARTGGISYIVAGEPGRRMATLERLEEARAADFDARIEDRTESTCMLGIVGPGAAAAIAEHLSEALTGRLQLMHTVAFEFHGFRALAMRTSDTGEDGFEFMVAPAVAQHVVETLTSAGIQWAGFEAQEVARVEACIPAYDPDLATGLSPAEADLDVMLGIEGGRDARILSAVLIDGDAPLPVGAVVARDGERVGELRSNVYTPGLRARIGLAILASAIAMPGTELSAEGRRLTIVAKPFLRRRGSV